MKKKILSALLALCLMLTALPGFAYTESTMCYDLESLSTWLLNYAQPFNTEMEIYYDSGLDWFMDDWSNLHTLFYNSGMNDWDATRDRTNRVIKITNIDYTVGKRLYFSTIYGDKSYIKNSEEECVLINARNIVAEARKQCSTELELERFFHDWLCRTVTYYASDEENTVYDSAIGALNYGKAECDGYSDAFYLLCSLAGLQVGYQHGNSLDGGGHIWNVICIDGNNWTHVDVTWDDNTDTSNSSIVGIRYNYFNLGDAWMALDHVWKSDCTVYPMSYNMDWNSFFYTISSQTGEEGFGAYYENLNDAAKYARARQKAGDASVHIMVPGAHTWDEFNSYLGNAGLRGRWYIYHFQRENYTCFDITLNQ